MSIRPSVRERLFPLRDAGCFHGRKFFEAIGPRFDHLERATTIINADVLDAWFPPAPPVLDALQESLPWLARTSPPTACEGLIEVVAETRGVEPASILPGAGSSDLIFRAFRHWLEASSSVLLLDPTYGEYAHVLEKVIGARVDRFLLSRDRDFEVDLTELERAIGRGYDLVVLVNPNSPTGRHIERQALEDMLRETPSETRIWIDETYIEYVGTDQSLERFASHTENVIVCKSMSKVYALSGLRIAYLCAAARQLDDLRAITPPWAVGLVAQLAGVRALECPDYYAQRYQQTHQVRDRLAGELGALGWKVVPGCANFLLVELPDTLPSAREFVEACQRHGLYLRDAGGFGSRVGERMIRIAVKDGETITRRVAVIRQVQTTECQSTNVGSPRYARAERNTLL